MDKNFATGVQQMNKLFSFSFAHRELKTIWVFTLSYKNKRIDHLELGGDLILKI